MMLKLAKLILFPLLTFSLMTACVVRVTPSSNPAPAPVVSAPSGTVINIRLNLIAYPGSQIFSLSNDRDDDDEGGSSTVRFATNASLEAVNAYFHREITARGWQRTRFEQKNSATKIESRYQRGRDDFEFKLDREGNSGRYKLEIEFDDD